MPGFGPGRLRRKLNGDLTVLGRRAATGLFGAILAEVALNHHGAGRGAQSTSGSVRGAVLVLRPTRRAGSHYPNSDDAGAARGGSGQARDHMRSRCGRWLMIGS